MNLLKRFLERRSKDRHKDRLDKQLIRGHFILALLDQDKTWINRGGKKIPLTDIDPQYAENIINFMEKRAPRYKFAVDLAEINFMDGPLGPSGDMAVDAANSALEESWDEPPIDWLRRQPLWQALDKRREAVRRI